MQQKRGSWHADSVDACPIKKGGAVAPFLPKFKRCNCENKSDETDQNMCLVHGTDAQRLWWQRQRRLTGADAMLDVEFECVRRGGHLTQTPVVTASTGAEGLYNGITSTGRSVAGLILDDGSYYVIYSATNNPSLIADAVVGTGASTNGSFSSADAIDLNLEGLGVVSATVSARYTEKTSLNGNIVYPSLSQTVAFTGTYNAAYETTPTLTAIAGTYSGRAGSLQGTEAATVVVSSAGALSGVGASGCVFTGSVAPHARGNAYATTITFGSAPCLLVNISLTGAAYFDSVTKRIYSIGVNSARTDGTIFVGVKS